MIEQSEEEINSMAPATTDSQEETDNNENSFGIDNFLLTALESPRDRLTILKLDQELEVFVKDTSRTRLNFPPTSSYQRLIIHRVAQYFKIDHVVLDVEGGKRAVVLFKTAESRVPILRFTDLIEQPEGPPAKAVKIMRRGQSDQKKTTSAPSSKIMVSSSSSSKEMKDKTLEQREEEYAKARARIFGNEESQDASKQVNTDQIPTTSQKQMPKKEEQKTTVRPPQNDSFEYNRNADSANWNRLWTPSPTDNYYNYEYYDMTMFNYRASPYPLDSNHYANYLAAAPTPTPTPASLQTTGDQNPNYQPLYPSSTYIPPNTLAPPKKSPTNQPKKTNETRPNMSPPSTPYYPPSRPPPIIYSYPNEDVWSFYAPNPVPYVPTNEPNMQTYYYDRRPPKSTQLFDPNAPSIPTKKTSRPFSSGVLEDMRQMQNFPRSPSHESFFQSPQGTTTNPGTTKPKEIQQIEVSQGSIPKPIRNESSQVEVGRLDHILEICDLTSEEELVQIEQSGATMKRLDSSTIVAIYRTASAANEALLKRYSGFSLRRWRAPVVIPNVPPTAQMTNLTIQ